MDMKLTYLKLELKRALKRLPYMYVGAVVLFLLVGCLGLLSANLLYGEGVIGRIQVGVSLPKEDGTAQQVVQMLGTMGSVNSVCDFVYMDLEGALDELEKGSLFAVLEVPRGFVQDIISGKNTPVIIWLPEKAGLEGKLFQALADAGAQTLGASQAGIYAGNEMYLMSGLQNSVPQLEDDLNRYYLDFSLQRLDYFRHLEVNGTGDVGVIQFYMISTFVLFMFLAPVPAGEYLLPLSRTMRVKLNMAGMKGGMRAISRIAGMTILLLLVSMPVLVIVIYAGIAEMTWILWGSWILVCIAVSSIVLVLYNLVGNLLGGFLLVFIVTVIQHFMAGGFLPKVFLPASLQLISPWLPSQILMNTMKMAMLAKFHVSVLLTAVTLTAVGILANICLERRLP